MQVHEHYQFRPVTAFLSVNYLDRFLSCSFLPVQYVVQGKIKNFKKATIQITDFPGRVIYVFSVIIIILLF